MTNRRTIHVTDDDVATAVPKDSGHCAIADAIRRQLPNVRGVSVDLQTIRWTDREEGKRYVYFTPLSAQRFLIAFDQGDRAGCAAQSFRLGDPVQVVPVKARDKSQAKRTKRATAHGPTVVQQSGPATADYPAGRVSKRGGNVPPLAALAHGRGTRREFGVRNAGRPDPK